MSCRPSIVSAGALGLALLSPHPASAAWPTDPLVNVPLCIAANDQSFLVSVADGAGGAIVAWIDGRSGYGNSDVYAQHVQSNGVVDPVWPVNGLAVCAAANDQRGATIVQDGAGGAIVTWVDARNGGSSIYAQHVLANGTVDPAWPADGRALCTAANEKYDPVSVADGSGGAIATWSDNRTGTYTQDIYVQHVLASGVVDLAWPTNGRAVCTASGAQFYPMIAADGAGGAIVTWEDIGRGSDIYAQRVRANGVIDPSWPVDGVALCSALGYQQDPMIVPDGTGGAIVTWGDYRGANSDIYAQHVQASGVIDPAWPIDGRALCTAGDSQFHPSIAADGASGAIVAWHDLRSGNSDIYAQRVQANGALDPAWPVNGRALCTAVDSQSGTRILSDGLGGAIVAWTDGRHGTLYPTNYDIYAQRVLANGDVDPQWPADGRALTSTASDQAAPTIATDGLGGAIATWEDSRNSNTDVYAQHVWANGQLGGVLVGVPDESTFAFSLDPVYPNPSSRTALTVRFSLAAAGGASIELIDVAGRRLEFHDMGSLGSGRHSIALGQGSPLRAGLYLVRLRQRASSRVTRAIVLE